MEYYSIGYAFQNGGGDTDVTILSRAIRWEDGIRYTVNKVIDVRPAASLKAGGCGVRYTVQVLGKHSYLFLEEDKWFVEARN